jgi:hypothetical protein
MGSALAETPSRASYGLTVACRTDDREAADDGQANDAWLSQTVGNPDPIPPSLEHVPLNENLS